MRVAASVLLFVFFYSFSSCAEGVGVERGKLIEQLLGDIKSKGFIEAVDAAERGLGSDDRLVRQSVLEPVLQHSDRRVRQVGLMYLFASIKNMNVELDLPDEIEKKIKDTWVQDYFMRRRIMKIEVRNFDPKSSMVSLYNFEVSQADINQDGFIVNTGNNCRLRLQKAAEGYLLGSFQCGAYAVPAKMPLP